MPLECASCGQLFPDREMFDALGSCFSCGGTEVVETEECDVCGASFPRGRSCPVCAGTRASAPATEAEGPQVDEGFDVDAFLARVREEPSRSLPVLGYRRPPRVARKLPAIEEEAYEGEAGPGRVLPPTRSARQPLLSRDERLPAPELLRLLREEGRALAS